jgi:hypothetical protein
MHFTLYHVNFAVRNRPDEAAHAALELFGAAESNERRLSQLSHAQGCLVQAIYSGQGKSEAQALLCRAEYLHAVLELFVEKNWVFRSEYNILRGRDEGIALAVFFFLNGVEKHCRALGALIGIDRNLIVTMAVRQIARLQGSQLVDFIAKRRDVLPKAFFDAILRVMVRGDNRACVLVVISNCWADLRDQCVRFLEYGFLPEAFSRAVDGGFRELIPVIAYRASVMGQIEICLSCQKVLH